MGRKKIEDKDKQKFKNIGLLKEDHELLAKLANSEQRSMARQLSVLIREVHGPTAFGFDTGGVVCETR
jgi:hypothetical protein